jgi:hypothetical protein
MADDDIGKQRVAASTPTTRTCAGCDLCCTAVGVQPLNKGAGVRCPHLRGEPGKSCSVYDSRPDDCRVFTCLWRMSDDLLPDWIAPASAGFVISVDGSLDRLPTVFTIHPDPLRPDNWMATRNVKAFKNLARQFNSLVVVGQAELARYIITPSGKEFSREQYPQMFANGGRSLRVPNSEFLAQTRPDNHKNIKTT